MPSDRDLAEEMVKAVERISREFVETRQQITRAMTPLYPRIIEVEKRVDHEAAKAVRLLEEDARERTVRQRELDAKIANQNVVASQQGVAIQQTIRTLNEHSEILQGQTVTLTHIQAWQRTRVLLELAMIVSVCIWLVVR